MRSPGASLSKWRRVTRAPIFDLRRGDHEDNRTSPHGTKVPTLLLTAVLEFNYLKASIGFLSLIVGPALFVGIMPSLVVYSSHRKLGVAAAHSRLVGLVILVLLATLAFRVGQPVAAKAIESFWRLHYTLVFPLFVAFREVMRSVFERVASKLTTVKDLDRGRRFGTVIGGLLLAGSGISMAAVIGLSFGLQLVNIERVQPWALARAAFGNAALILGLSTAIESLYWVWRELVVGGSVQDWAPSAVGQTTPAARVAHLSDLHVVGERYGCRMEAGTRGPIGNRLVQRALEQLLAAHRSSILDRVLLTGDITDAGTRAEWTEFMDLMRDFPLRSRLSFVPGNHDVNIVDRNNVGRFDLPWSVSDAMRKLRTLLVLDEVQGDRVRIVDHKTGTLGPLLSDYLREGNRADLLRELAEDGTASGRREMIKLWGRIFPLVEVPEESDRYGLILLDSNARSHFALTNAIGVVSKSQSKALKAILSHSTRPWIILLHHHLVEYPVDSISLADRIGLALMNAPEILNVIAPHSSRCIVFHGHRHRDWIGVSRGVVLCSAPSTSLGSQEAGSYEGSFYIHGIALENQQIGLTKPERVKFC